MKIIASVLLIITLSACGGSDDGAAPALDKYDFSVSVHDSTIVNAQVVETIRAGAPGIAQDLNNALALPARAIAVTFKDCGTENAFFDPSDGSITVCWELFLALLNYNPTYTDNMLAFIFAHELGHALVDQYDLPIIGSPEDVADVIGVVLALDDTSSTAERVEVARGIILTGDWMNTTTVDYYDAHTTGPARLANLVCWAVGAEPSLVSDPVLQSILQGLVAAGRNCSAEYTEKEANVDTLIGKYRKN